MELPRGLRGRRELPPDSGWMTDEDLRAYRYDRHDDDAEKGNAILLGRNGGDLIGVADDRHLLTVAGSRSGKSSTCLKPNLFLWPSSELCIDPKGELAKDTAKHRHEVLGQDVYILDPFGEVKGEAARFRCGYNPLSELAAGDPDDAIDDAAAIAESLIVPDKGGDQHWTLAAKNLVRGLMLYDLDVAARGNDAASLATLRDSLTAPLGGDDTPDEGRVWLSTIFKLMARNEDAFEGVVAGIGATMQDKPKNERGSIISTAVEQTAFLDSRAMRTHLGGDGLPSLRLLKQRPTTIYLVLPARRMATHFRWLRLILTLALSALEREPMGFKGQVLFVLEEFPQLGYMRQIEAAAGLMAGFQVKLWTIIQDLPQIKSLYRDSWETFIGNAGVIQAFGNTDATTTEYISRALGTLLMKERKPTNATPTSVTHGGAVERETARTVPLLAPFEVSLVGARDLGAQIIMIAGKRPAYISRLSHEEVKRVDETAGRQPDH